MFGIEGIEIYFPKTYVDQSEYQQYKKAGTGKYTKGLGQLQLSFSTSCEDVNSMSLTVVRNLMKNYNIHPSQVGRLELGTETLIDKSKSTKTVLMTLFKGYHDIEGATSINACYGATNALINTLNWISSPFWNGKYGIVVATDLAVYEDGPARCTGGAGAVAILIGPNGKIVFNKQRSSYMDHVYDFYKPKPTSQYPIVDGKLSIDSYLTSLSQCYKLQKQKCGNTDILKSTDYLCFHSPFSKMVEKSYTKLCKMEDKNIGEQTILESFKNKVQPSLYISKRIGNIYTGSLYSCLMGLLILEKDVTNKAVVMFSYGSGSCATLLQANILSNPLRQDQIEDIHYRLNNRVKVSPEQFTQIMLQREKSYSNFLGKIPKNESYLFPNTFYLQEIDELYRRKYGFKGANTQIQLQKSAISSVDAMNRLQNLNKYIKINKMQEDNFSKFYKLSVKDRITVISDKGKGQLDLSALKNGGIEVEKADMMVENVIGKLSLPLAVVPLMVINKKQYVIPMCIEEPSVVAACSSIGKLIAPYSFQASSTPNIMIGQIHLPNAQITQVHKILGQKLQIISHLNTFCQSMVQRGGGVTDLRTRELQMQKESQTKRHFSIDIHVNVCDAMGANITNILCEKAKDYISKMGIKTGIAILSNYCVERKALSYFEIPVSELKWKGIQGIEVAQKIMEAYQFAKRDRFRATTHNKGIMNGVDAVCLATGQDWRAVQSSIHSYAARGKRYSPLSEYKIFEKDGVTYFRGSLELPIAVGVKGGVLEKNPLYKTTLNLLGQPNAKELSQIIVTVGLAQNFAALRALAIEGINKGHLALHARSIAQQSGVPNHLLDQACKFMAFNKKYDIATAKKFLQTYQKPKL